MVRHRYIDANIILRYLTNDPSDMAERAAALFHDIQMERTTVILEDVVLAEVVWTLRSYYHVDKRDIAEQLSSLVSYDRIQNADKSSITHALGIYHLHNVGFADALLAARALSVRDAELISFDRRIARVPGVTRVEPG